MKNISRLLCLFIALLALARVTAQTAFPYSEVEGDPYKTRIYKLKNGLTVMLSVNKAAPQVQTMIAVRAGSRNDPADNTGLAHYLEHLLFKGTENFGTKSYSAEQPLLAKIEAAYNYYGNTTDPGERERIYRMIDSLSLTASRLGIANEYDRMMQTIGATGTNAFTTNDQTVYLNNIPANQLEKWLKIEQDRFTSPVFRIFHTELEAVYEEKNRGMDNDNVKAFEALMLGVFPGHPYGEQTTIGTVEHLKNPSLPKIREFYNKYYKANNMALIMAGDFEYDSAIAMVNNYLGQLPGGGADPWPRLLIDSIDMLGGRAGNQQLTVTGPKEEKVYLGYRTNGGAGSRDALLLYMADMILANSQAGLLDIDLNKAQKVQYAVCSPDIMRDFCMHYFVAYPKEGQSLQECRQLLLDELEKLKRGEFDESIMHAIVENLRLNRATTFEDNYARCSNMMESFVFGYAWNDFVQMDDRLEKLTKQDVVNFANRTYTDQKRTTVYKLTGKDTSIQKIPKPHITPIETNREAQSKFARELEKEPVPPLQAHFPDLNTAIQTNQYSGASNVELQYVPNNQTDYFTLYIRYDMGRLNDPWLELLADYMPYIATATKTNEDIAREFFNMACEFGYEVQEDKSYIYLRGLNENFEPAYALLQDIFTNARVDETKLKNLVSDILKAREDNKTNKGILLQAALKNYARYGKNNPFTHILSEKELKKADAQTIQQKINGLLGYQYTVWYYGPMQQETLAAKAGNLLQPAKKLKETPKAHKYEAQKHKKNVVYFVPFDMVQAEVLWDRPMMDFTNGQIASIAVFNEYFGSGMYSLVFQTIRESRALAYSSSAIIGIPAKMDKPVFVTAYVGTQADKLKSAMLGMNELMNTLPADKFAGDLALESVRKQLEAERIHGQSLLFEKEQAARLGLKITVSQWMYESLGAVTYDQLVALQNAAYKDQHFAICIIGSKDLVNTKELKDFGKVVVLTPEDVFGY